MNARGSALAALALVANVVFAQPTVTDATGRAIVVPSHVHKVFAAGPPASVFVLALAPDKPAGWTRALHRDELPFLPPEVANLPSWDASPGKATPRISKSRWPRVRMSSSTSARRRAPPGLRCGEPGAA